MPLQSAQAIALIVVLSWDFKSCNWVSVGIYASFMRIAREERARMNPEIYSRMAAIEVSHWWFRARRAIVAKILTDLHLPDRGRILDAGCGTGGNLSMLSRFGEVEAVEMDGWARNIAAAKGIAPVVSGSLPDGLPFQPDSFDLVALFDVLEHVPDDVASLRSLSRLLKADGSLVITVPAFPFLWSRHDEVHHHCRRYRIKELERKVSEAGMTVVYASYFNTLLFPLVAAVRLLGRMRGSKGEGDLSMPPAWLNQVLYAVFASERLLLGRWVLPFGVSALVVARKGT